MWKAIVSPAMVYSPMISPAGVGTRIVPRNSSPVSEPPLASMGERERSMAANGGPWT
jgi:hypothetical protein